MDVSGILAAQAERHNAVTVEKDIDLQLDLGYLTVTDSNPVDADEHNRDLEAHLQSTARDGVQVLLSSLLQLPTQQTPEGPLTLLPEPTTLLPRSKPLPKPKPPTKWERFAAAKGIQKKRKERKAWDEERGEWVARWGSRDAKNKEGEGQWLSEVKANADVSANPEKELRDARKTRVAKNQRQQLQNQATSEREQRKSEIERTIATTRISTASMGKFDHTLEGEKKPRGVKRKFEPTERSVEEEKKASLALISKLDSSGKKSKKGDDVLNVRKAIRHTSKGKGAVALANETSSKNSKKSSKSRKR